MQPIWSWWLGPMLLAAALACPARPLVAQPGPTGQKPGQAVDPSQLRKADPPSAGAGVNYTVPAEAEIKQAIDRIRDHFVRSTAYRVIDTVTGQPVADLATPIKTAVVDTRAGEFNDWTYSMGVVLAAMLHVTEVTGDPSFQAYAIRNFDFIFDYLPYFRQQAKAFGVQRGGFGRLLEMRELDDCGAIGAALVKAYAKKSDPRYREGIDLVDGHIRGKQMRLPDGTLARPRPVPVALWIDDLYMSVPFLAQMGRLTGEVRYYDDAAQQVLGMSERLFDRSKDLYDHSWFADADLDARFFWGRGAGWALMATAELLSVLPDGHPRRGAVLDQFRRAVRGVAAMQAKDGAWHQLLDRVDSYTETSATAMFTFAIARGVNRGWIPAAYAPVAQAGWRAIEQRVRRDGQIEGICVGTTAAYDAVYYYNRPTELRAMQGYGPVMMAGAEMITLLRDFDIRHVNNTFYYSRKKR